MQIKYVKWNGNTNDVICEAAMSRQFDAVSSYFFIEFCKQFVEQMLFYKGEVFFSPIILPTAVVWVDD